jgi:TetR/AcrR family transcriptional repressor of uid operon
MNDHSACLVSYCRARNGSSKKAEAEVNLVAVQHSPGPRDRILAAARQLFSSQGFHQTPVSELAIKASVSVGQIYRLFKDKNAVILAIVSDSSELKAGAFDNVLKAVDAGTMSIREAFVQLATRSLSETEESLSFEILAEAYRNPEVADQIGEICERYRSIVRKMAVIANPTLSEESLDGAEEVLLGLLFGLGHRTLSRPRLPIRETAEQTAGMIMAAFTCALCAPPDEWSDRPLRSVL